MRSRMEAGNRALRSEGERVKDIANALKISRASVYGPLSAEFDALGSI